ncbi:hypothetical protein GW17_00046961 [Ensete ventricosum]|nr:hypothetical protein GW17_00046961 [Ensete ventricosum]
MSLLTFAWTPTGVLDMRAARGILRDAAAEKCKQEMDASPGDSPPAGNNWTTRCSIFWCAGSFGCLQPEVCNDLNRITGCTAISGEESRRVIQKLVSDMHAGDVNCMQDDVRPTARKKTRLPLKYSWLVVWRRSGEGDEVRFSDGRCC